MKLLRKPELLWLAGYWGLRIRKIGYGEGYRTEVSMTGTMALKIERFGGGENEKVQGRCGCLGVSCGAKKKSQRKL